MNLTFEEHENGAGPTVVCLPMFGTTRSVTAAALGPALAGADLREVYVDLPGHEDSPATVEATSDAVLETVLGFLAARRAADVLLAGCSYGGYLAAAIARRRPELVRGLLLVCPGVRAETVDRDLPTDLPDTDDPGWLDDTDPELREHLDLALGHRTRTIATTVSAVLGSGTKGNSDYQSALRGDNFALTDEDVSVSFAGPTTVVTGRQDRIVGFADQYRQMAHYSRGTFAVLDGAGHYLPFEQPALLRMLAQDWLRRCTV